MTKLFHNADVPIQLQVITDKSGTDLGNCYDIVETQVLSIRKVNLVIVSTVSSYLTKCPVKLLLSGKHGKACFCEDLLEVVI